MTIQTNQATDETPLPQRAGVGCGVIGVFVLSVISIIGVSIVYLAGQWIFEQFLFEGSLGLPDWRVFLGAGYGLALVLPLSLLTILVRSPEYHIIFKTWLFASFFTFLTLPLRFFPLTAWQPVAAGQLLALALYLLIVTRWLIGRNQGLVITRGTFGGWQVAMMIAGLLWIPWVFWGALGSWLDSILGMMVGVGIGGAISFTLRPGLSQNTEENPRKRNWVRLIKRFFLVFITLLIFSSGSAPIGLQYLQPVILASLSLVVTMLADWGRLTSKGALNWGTIALMLGIAASSPLVWVDGDELMLVIGSGSGEIMWISLLGLSSNFLVALLAGGVALGFYHLIANAKVSMGGVRWKIVAGLTWMVALGFYFSAGQPGFYGERLFVILKDQGDLSQIQAIEDPIKRREAVYDVLTEHSLKSQSDLAQIFSRFGIEFQSYYLVNGLEVNGGPLLRIWLNTRPEVDRVLDSPRLRPLNRTPLPVKGSQNQPDGTIWNLSLIRADQVWEELGIRGAGVVIGQSDSGVDGNHPELSSSYRGKNGRHNYHWFDPWNGSLAPTDIGGHGTHTLGSIVGDRVGVAPDAEWIGCVNLARNLANPALYLDCMQFMLAPFPFGGNPAQDGVPSRGAHILNNSWGCPEVEGCDATVLLPAVTALRIAGVFVVVSAGNSGLGGCETVNSPLAIYGEVMTVGAVNQSANLAGFSSVGPVVVDESNRIKPELLAPGDLVVSSYPGGTYESASGTSMAGPHVAGVVALMWSANPNLIGDVETTTRILTDTAQPYLGVLPECVLPGPPPKNGVGYGIVDAYEAVKVSLKLAQ